MPHSPEKVAIMIHHESVESVEDESPLQAARAAKQGLILCVLYAVVYAGFVGISAFAPEWMEQTPLAGINIAILYGFALILLAFFLALLYGWLCRRRTA